MNTFSPALAAGIRKIENPNLPVTSERLEHANLYPARSLGCFLSHRGAVPFRAFRIFRGFKHQISFSRFSLISHISRLKIHPGYQCHPWLVTDLGPHSAPADVSCGQLNGGGVGNANPGTTMWPAKRSTAPALSCGRGRKPRCVTYCILSAKALFFHRYEFH